MVVWPLAPTLSSRAGAEEKSGLAARLGAWLLVQLFAFSSILLKTDDIVTFFDLHVNCLMWLISSVLSFSLMFALRPFSLWSSATLAMPLMWFLSRVYAVIWRLWTLCDVTLARDIFMYWWVRRKQDERREREWEGEPSGVGKREGGNST